MQIVDTSGLGTVDLIGRNKLAQFRQPYGKRTVAMPELRKLVPAYGPRASGTIYPIKSTVPLPLAASVIWFSRIDRVSLD